MGVIWVDMGVIWVDMGVIWGNMGSYGGHIGVLWGGKCAPFFWNLPRDPSSILGYLGYFHSLGRYFVKWICQMEDVKYLC